MNKINANSTTNPSIYEILPSLKKMGYNITIADGKIALTGLDENIKELAMEVLDEVGYDFVRENNETLNGKAPTYNNPIIPVGFKALETTDASWNDKNKDGYSDGWNDGLVIQDENGNEFVWVPVDGANVPYAKWCKKNIAYSNANLIDVPDELPDGVNENTQITKYGGFYIGRYEAGVPKNQSMIISTNSDTSNVSGVPQVKQGVTPWCYVDYTNANANAKSLHNTSYVKSGLITGTMWDTTCKWIKNIGVYENDSRTYGNHNNSESPANVSGYGARKITGYSEYWKTKNIYDLAGNVWECTNEDMEGKRIYRGGSYFYDGNTYSLACRTTAKLTTTTPDFGFRIALYIM